MAMEKITENGVAIALVTGTCALTDEQTALDLIMEARYTLGAERIAIEKAAVSPDFFILSTGLAGAVLQKFINYGAKLAVYGDYSDIPANPCGILSARATGAGISFFPATVRRGSRGRSHPSRPQPWALGTSSKPRVSKKARGTSRSTACVYADAVPGRTGPQPAIFRFTSPGLEQVQIDEKGASTR